MGLFRAWNSSHSGDCRNFDTIGGAGMKKKHITEILELIHMYGNLQNKIGIQLGAGVQNELIHSDRKKAEELYEKIEKKLTNKYAD